MATNKKQHWQDVVFEPSGVVPGTYDRPQFTVNQYGFITDATSSVTPSQTVVPTINDLPGIPSPATGDLAVVLNTGGSEEEELYIWNNANTDLGAPYVKWRLLATTELATPPVNFRNEIVGIAPATALGPVTSPDAIVKAVHVTITVPYTFGTTMRIVEDGGPTLMPTSSINTQLIGTYTEELSDNNTKLNNTGQLRSDLFGGPLVGQSLVYVEYIVQP